MRIAHWLAKSTLAAVLLLAAAGCENEGPLEKAGENLDDAAEDTGEAIEEAGEEVKEAAGGS